MYTSLKLFVPVWCPAGAGRWVCSNGLVSTEVGKELVAAGREEHSTASSPLHQQGAEEEPLKQIKAVESNAWKIYEQTA